MNTKKIPLKIIMSLVMITIIVSIVMFFFFAPFKKENLPTSVSDSTQKKTTRENFYWTCPMHPQIRQDHPGECPICHMKLVKISESPASEATNPEGQQQNGDRAIISATPAQLELMGVQKTTVEKMSLTAKVPISGRIISSPNGSFQVAFQVYESEIQHIVAGLNFSGETTTNPDAQILGIITSVDNIIDPTSRTLRVLGTIKNSQQALIPETSFRGEIQIKLSNQLFIPQSAVLHTGTNDLVYQFTENNKLTPKVVRLGLKTEGFYQVLSGLNLGDMISSGPNFLIDSEAKIRGAND